MAREEIKLVGSFKDDITPQLKKLNKEIAGIGRTFTKFNKKLAPVTKSFAKMAMSAREFSTAMKTQRQSIDQSARAMREYSRQAGKMSGALRRVTDQRMKAQRAMGMSRAQARKSAGGGVVPMPSSPAAGKGTGKAFGASAGATFKQSIGASAIGTTIGMMASQMIMGAANKIGGMLAAPFQKFGAMFAERIGDEMDDIKSAGGLFALDMDLTSASGNERFFKNYNEALRYQEKLNIDMAQSAASLPGVTSQYVSTSRQLTDTIQMVMEKDRDKFNVMAQKFGANVSGGGVDASKEALRTVLQKQTEQVMLQSMGQQGGLPMHIMIQQLLGKEAKGGKLGIQAFTNRFRAAFQKNPLLKNFLLRAEEELAKTEAGSVERLQLVMETFDRAMPKEVINKMRGSISGMQEALRSGLLDPQAGLFGMSRANFDPEDGQLLMKKNVDDLGNVLFKVTEDIFPTEASIQKVLKDKGIEKGLEDSIKGLEFTAAEFRSMGYTVDEFTGAVTKNGKEFGKFSTSTTYIFEQIREILAGYGPVLLEFVGFLPSLFDPFGEMTKSLMGFRDKAQSFINNFNNKLDKIEDVALKFSNMTDPEKQRLGSLLKKQSRSRAAFATMADFLETAGGVDKKLIEKVQKITGDTSEAGIKAVDAGALNKMFVPLFQAVINSDMMKEFGNIGGLIIGGITKAVVTMIQGVTNFAKGQGTNKLMKGFIKGFSDAFGDMSFNQAKGIIVDAVVSIISKALDLLFTQVIPNLVSLYIKSLFKGLFSGSPVTMLFSALGIYKLGKVLVGATTSLMLLAKAASQSAFALGVTGRIGPAASKGGAMAMRGGQAVRAAGAQTKGALAGMGLGAGAKGVKTGRGISKVLAPLAKASKGVKGKVVGTMAAGVVKMATAAPGLAKMGKSMLGIAKSIPLLNVAFAGLDFASSKAAGESTVAAAGGAAGGLAGSVIGATLGSFLGPIGTLLGGIIGHWLGSWVGKTFGKLLEGIDIGGMWNTLAAPVGNLVNGIMSFIGDEFSKFMENPAMYLGEAVGKYIKFFVFDIPKMLSDAVSFLINKVVEVLMGLPAAIEGVMASIGSAISSFVDGIKKSIADFTNSIAGLPAQLSAGLGGVKDALVNWIGGLGNAVKDAISNFGKGVMSGMGFGGGSASSSYNGNTSRTMSLGDAISTEMKNKPAGSHLVIANSSETVIPAYDGLMGGTGQPFKGFDPMELESVAGYNRMKPYVEQVMEMAKKQAESLGAFAGSLGGGSATLNAMEALGHQNGLTTTSGHRPGDPGFHGVNRARDLSNGSGETPEMNKVANLMASQFGANLTELIYTPLGFSIKNGQKTGLISPDNHYHHIHVAVAEGLAKAAVFSSERAAMQYEKQNMPAGASPMKVDLSSMTANSSEFGGPGGDINIDSINISGVQDPEAIANQVAEEILVAVRRSAYGELYTS